MPGLCCFLSENGGDMPVKFMNRWFFATVFLSFGLLAAPDVRVDGLFNGRAVVNIDGKQHLLKEGQQKQGVRLISSDSKQAVIEVNGKAVTMGISDRISSSYTEAEVVEVRVPRGQGGHYFVSGFINGRAVDFMVDTGATSIAMSRPDAERLGIDLRKGQTGSVSTANGVVTATTVNVSKVTIGGITVHQVPVTVVNGNFPANVLLGNSFLSRVNMSEEEGVLVLRKKQ